MLAEPLESHIAVNNVVVSLVRDHHVGLHGVILDVDVLPHHLRVETFFLEIPFFEFEGSWRMKARNV